MGKIAIVGMACEYPDATDTNQLWNNILSKKRSFRRIPNRRLPMNEYYSEDMHTPDKFYSEYVSVIEDYFFNREKFNVSGSTFRSTDLTHWLALDVAARSLEDAGYLKHGRELPKEKTGVLVGNTLTGEFSRSSVMRLRWPYVQKIINEIGINKGWNKEDLSEFLVQVEERFKQPFPEVNEDTLAGGLSNTIAGRICNHFDLNGGGYTVDGACSSSLLAVSNGCTNLMNKQLDVAIVGGIDLSLDPFELVGFAKTQALAKNEMKIFDKESNGFWPGEGCGFVVLMREDYAKKNGFRIYATIEGWGISSDGRGGITRPELKGQTLAIQRAYQMAEYPMNSVQYFEGHGTGTKVGDNVELLTLTNFKESENSIKRPAYISSIKGNIGHTKAAAGIAGLIKAVLAISNKIIPPITGCANPHELLEDAETGLRITDSPLPWINDEYLRAGVSSMGFGGINVHLALQSIEKQGKTELSNVEKYIASSFQDHELLFFSGESIKHIQSQITNVLEKTKEISFSELPGLSNYLYKIISKEHEYRAAILIQNPKDIKGKLTILIDLIEQGINEKVDLINGLFIGKHKISNIGFLFPGQGAPVREESGVITNRFFEVREFYERYPEKINGSKRNTMNVQPNIIKASLASIKLLKAMNIEAKTVIGHSLGELSALFWSGAVKEEDIIEIAKIRGKVMSAASPVKTTMASIVASKTKVQALLNDDAVIACYNSDNQFVISGREESVKDIVKRAEKDGVTAKLLPVSHGFHSEFMSGGQGEFSEFLNNITFMPITKKIISTITEENLQNEIDIKKLLVSQLTEPVLFTKALKKLDGENIDYLIEVGPGKILGSLVTQQTNIPVVSMQSESDSLKSLLGVMAISFVKNTETDLSILFNRHIKSFNLEAEKHFFSNPCEDIDTIPFELDLEQFTNKQEVAASVEIIEHTNKQTDNTLDKLKTILSQKLELPKTQILNESRMLDDLHLNSITVGQIIAQISNEIGLSTRLMMTDYANANVKEIADALDNSSAKSESNINYLEGIQNWVGIFNIDHISRKNHIRLSKKYMNEENTSFFKLIIPNDFQGDRSIFKKLEEIQGRGIIFVVPSSPNKKHIECMLNSGKQAAKDQIPYVIIQHPTNTCSSFAKSFFLETKIDTCVITIPHTGFSIEDIIEEIQTVKGFKEVTFDKEGNRKVPVLKPHNVDRSKPLTLDKEDVLLFTGGGKGIAAECALSLAVETGSKLAIIGRSDPEKDKDLKNTLERAELLNITYCYEKADITNKYEVINAISNIQDKFGVITGFTHAAGINNPYSIDNLDMKEFNRTLETKYSGCENVLDFLNPEELKFFISFSSIIGRSGLQGESHYATSNEWLTNLTNSYEKKKNVKSLSLEWSVWNGIGMGNSLGVVESLKQQGITPIPVNVGVKYFISIIGSLLNGDLKEKVLVIAGRMGELSTLEFYREELPLLRFVEEVKLFYPQNEIIIDIHLSKEKDPYLEDHILDKNMLFPAVMSLEAMAQGLMTLTGNRIRPTFESVIFNHPIIVDNHLGETIRLSIVRVKHDQFKVNIYTKSNDYQIIHFEAVCIYQEDEPREIDTPTREFDINKRLSLNPDLDMYNVFLFQKGKFKRIKNYLKISSRESQAIITKESNNTWFNKLTPSEILLEDPGVRDACIHSIQACIPHKTLIPTKVNKIIHWSTSTECDGDLVAVGREDSQKNDVHIYDLHIYNSEGEILESWFGLTFKEMGDNAYNYSPGPLLSSFIERKFREKYEIKDFRVLLEKNNRSYNDLDLEQRKNIKENIVYQLTGKSIPYIKRENGSPVKQLSNISFSNNNFLTLAIESDGIVGCDIENINEEINMQTWRTMLGEKFFNLAGRLKMNSGSKSANYIKMWTVLECIKKSDIPQDLSLEIVEDNGGEVYFKTASTMIGTYQINNLIISILVERI